MIGTKGENRIEQLTSERPLDNLEVFIRNASEKFSAAFSFLPNHFLAEVAQRAKLI
jgi:hypothetical protein